MTFHQVNSFDNFQENTKIRCEYLIIGSGAGGSVAALELTAEGKDVLLIEEGGDYNLKNSKDSFSERMRLLYRGGGVTPFIGSPIVGFGEGKTLGGSTVINGGLIWRTPEKILEQWEKNFNLTGYDKSSLSRHFEKIESILSVSKMNPLDKTHNLDSLKLWHGAKSLGWKIVPVPRALSKCIFNNECPSGCTSGAKKSMRDTYLPLSIKNGLRVITNARAIQVKRNGSKNLTTISFSKNKNKHLEVISDYVVLSGGAIQTPHLINKSGLNKKAGDKLEFHLNLKILAQFDDEINSNKGTMFTSQIQEFENDGILIMGSNYRLSYLASSFAHLDNKVISELVEKYNYCGLYVGQIKAESKGKINSTMSDPIVIWSMCDSDLVKSKLLLQKMCEVLFASGAIKLFLPVKNIPPIVNLAELKKYLDIIKKSDLEMISVHAMSSCPMGTEIDSIVDTSGRLNGTKNIIVCDASVLPTNIGESPQGTIMAFSHEIIQRNLF